MISNKRIAKALAGFTTTLIENNVNIFIGNKDLTQLVVRTDNCEIVLTRGDDSPKTTKIRGFAIGEDSDDVQDYDEDGDELLYGKN